MTSGLMLRLRRRILRRPLWLVSLPVAFLAGAAATQAGSCAATYGSSSGGSTGSYPVSGTSGVGGDAAVDVMPDAPPPPHPIDYSALCGVGCKVGDPSSCGAVGQGGATAATSSGTGGQTSSSSSVSTGATGAVSTSTATSTGSGMTGSSSGSGAPPASMGCQISATGASPFTACGYVGVSGAEGPCQSAADCIEGLGCVSTPGGGLCRPYCCGSLEACGKGTFCTPSAMEERADRAIPVCTPTTPCQLLTSQSCSTGEVCTIVRADGTTSCVVKGPGQLCQPCPCDDGYVCSATGICQKLCHTGQTNECGAGSTCQGGSTKYPKGVGICVGGQADCVQ